jgi:hypothetical protein
LLALLVIFLLRLGQILRCLGQLLLLIARPQAHGGQLTPMPVRLFA